MQIVSNIKSELKQADDKKKMDINYKMAAMAIVDAGFQSYTSLAFAEGEKLAKYTSNLATKALITELVNKATYEAKLKTRVRDLEFDERALLLSNSKGKSSDLSAERLAEDLHPTKVAKQWQKCQQQGLDLGVPIFSEKEKLVAATKGNEKGVLGYLKDQATQLQIYTNRRSLKYVAAGLRCWHSFAVGCLGYLPCRTLPPRCAYDVVRFISIFHNGGTAANYVGYLKFGCNLKGFPTTWSEKQVSVALKGLSKASLDYFGGPREQRTC